MKLLYCSSCNSVFNLSFNLKQCDCGEVKGKYIDNVNAEVNGRGYSIAIGNGSLMSALHLVHRGVDMPDWRDNPEWQLWWEQRPGKNMVLAWARPHIGFANSHTTINPNL